jgi:hypothetical protein
MELKKEVEETIQIRKSDQLAGKAIEKLSQEKVIKQGRQESR